MSSASITRWATAAWAIHLPIVFVLTIVLCKVGDGFEGKSRSDWLGKLGFFGLFYFLALIIASATIKHLRYRATRPTPLLDRIQDCPFAQILGMLAGIACNMYML